MMEHLSTILISLALVIIIVIIIVVLIKDHKKHKGSGPCGGCPYSNNCHTPCDKVDSSKSPKE